MASTAKTRAEGSRGQARPDEILTIEELSEYLKISQSTIYKLAQRGGIPGMKIGKRWRFHRAAIDGWFFEQAKQVSPRRAGGKR